jgi:hypothetical protein
MKFKRIAVDTSKSVFTLHGVDEQDRLILRQNLPRAPCSRAALARPCDLDPPGTLSRAGTQAETAQPFPAKSISARFF